MVVREPHLLRAESQANSTLPVSVATETRHRGVGYGALPVSHRPEVGLHYPGDFPTCGTQECPVLQSLSLEGRKCQTKFSTRAPSLAAVSFSIKHEE